eukprot:jgi/Chlat1/3575/Chrsp234S03565
MEEQDMEAAILNTPLLMNGRPARRRRPVRRTEHTNVIESLDYEPVQNVVGSVTLSAHKFSKMPRRFYGYTGNTLAKWGVTFLIGVLTGVVAFVIEWTARQVELTKNAWTLVAMQESLWKAVVAFVAFDFALVSFSSFLVLFVAPAAAGGGVTLVMAYLNGAHVPDFLRPRTLVVKIVGTICSMTSSLPVGPEGPMVQIGTCIASFFTTVWSPRRATTTVPYTSVGHAIDCSSPDCQATHSVAQTVTRPSFLFDFHKDEDQREFLSAGAAAGIAAAFGAPIGGVLFALEEAASFWSRKVMWRCLLCASSASFVLALLHGPWTQLTIPGLISFKSLRLSFRFWELPLFILTAAVIGVVGAFFNILHEWLAKIRPSRHKPVYRYFEALLVVTICVITIFLLPHFFGRCLPQPESWDTDKDGDFGFQFSCTELDLQSRPYYNDLATCFFALPEQVVKRFLEMRDNKPITFTFRSLCIFAASYVLLSSLAFGIAVPGGLFMPSITSGAGIGAVFGVGFAQYFPSLRIEPGLFALVGATAMLGGVFRSTISLVVIVVEGTGAIDFLFAIIAAVVVANYVAHHFYHAGVYENDLEREANLAFLTSDPPSALRDLSAADIMAKDAICFREVEQVAVILRTLRSCEHNGFPVLHNNNHPHAGKLCGFILRSQLLVLLQRRAFTYSAPVNQTRSQLLAAVAAAHHNGAFAAAATAAAATEAELEQEMRIYHFRHNKHCRHLSSCPETVDKLMLDWVLKDKPQMGHSSDADVDHASADDHRTQQSSLPLTVDIGPYMHISPVTVHPVVSAVRVYSLFRGLGLRHLAVVDLDNKVVGIITRKDLIFRGPQPQAPASTVHSPRVSRWLGELEDEEDDVAHQAPAPSSYNVEPAAEVNYSMA